MSQQGQKRKTTAPSTSTTRKKGTTKKAKDEAPAKLAYEMTDEECKTAVAAEVKSHFAPVQPQPKEKIPTKTNQHFVDILERPSSQLANMPSDYDRCIKKSYNEQMQRTKVVQAGKKFPNSENRKYNRSPRSRCFPIRTYTPTLLATLVSVLLN